MKPDVTLVCHVLCRYVNLCHGALTNRYNFAVEFSKLFFVEYLEKANYSRSDFLCPSLKLSEIIVRRIFARQRLVMTSFYQIAAQKSPWKVILREQIRIFPTNFKLSHVLNSIFIKAKTCFKAVFKLLNTEENCLL